MFEFSYIFYNLISGRYYKISWMDGMSVWRPSMHLVLIRVLVVFLYFWFDNQQEREEEEGLLFNSNKKSLVGLKIPDLCADSFFTCGFQLTRVAQVNALYIVLVQFVLFWYGIYF